MPKAFVALTILALVATNAHAHPLRALMGNRPAINAPIITPPGQEAPTVLSTAPPTTEGTTTITGLTAPRAPSTERPSTTAPVRTTPPSTETIPSLAPFLPPSTERGAAAAPPTTEAGGATGPTLSPQQQDAVKNIGNLPGVGNDTNVDPAVVNSVSSGLIAAAASSQNTQQASKVLTTTLSSASAVSVAKAFSNVIISQPQYIDTFATSFSLAVQEAAQAGDVLFLTKCVTSFSLAMVFAAVTGNQQVVKTAVPIFVNSIVSSAGCAEWVAVIFNVLITIIIATPARIIIFF